MKLIIILSSFFFVHNGLAQSGFSIKYFQLTFGHVHLKPYSYSDSKTTLQCGQSVKVFDKNPSSLNDWSYVQVGEDLGYIKNEYLNLSRPENCMQTKYPVFFQSLNLDLTDLYYWGRIYDHSIEFTSGS